MASSLRQGPRCDPITKNLDDENIPNGVSRSRHQHIAPAYRNNYVFLQIGMNIAETAAN